LNGLRISCKQSPLYPPDRIRRQREAWERAKPTCYFICPRRHIRFEIQLGIDYGASGGSPVCAGKLFTRRHGTPISPCCVCGGDYINCSALTSSSYRNELGNLRRVGQTL
jgi:hypothetical protein